MDYPKPIMGTQELRKMGFPREYLERAYKSSSNTFAHKTNPKAVNSPILFDTAGFEKWRQSEIKVQRFRKMSGGS